MNKSDFVIVHQGKHVGLTTAEGVEILPCEYDQIPDYDDDGYVRFIRSGYYGTVDLDGKVAIPLSLELTHLGVFHQGTARARKDGLWGLVDPHGQSITGFIYASMNAYYKYGYSVVTQEGQHGWLNAKGVFKPSGKPKVEPPTPDPVPKPEPPKVVPPKVVPPKPKFTVVATHDYTYFNTPKFLAKLDDWMGSILYPLDFYYRDTDAEVDVEQCYKPGHFIRIDSDLYLTQKLLRPVHKLRYLIAASSVISTQQRTRNAVAPPPSEGLEYKLPAYSHFLVVDVQRYAGTTQVVLLHFPHGAMLLAQQYGISASNFKPKGRDYLSLKEAARRDLLMRCAESVYGYSLQSRFTNLMQQPVGCDSTSSLLPLVSQPYSSLENYSTALWDILYDARDCDTDWDSNRFLEKSVHPIREVKGDITCREGGLLLRPVWPEELPSDHFTPRFVAKASKALMTQCAKHLPLAPNSILLTPAVGFPYQQILHLRMPSTTASPAMLRKYLKSGIAKVFKTATQLEIQSILIPKSIVRDAPEFDSFLDILLQQVKQMTYLGEIEILFE